MKHLFIKCISKSINNGLKFIFLDESGFKLENNNYYVPINQANFLIFLEEMKNKIEPIESKNYIIILDNARFHLSQKIINFVEDNKMKV